MNLVEFSKDYAETVEGLEPWMRDAGKAPLALREEYGYTLENLLERRMRALAGNDVAGAFERIRVADDRLRQLAGLVRELFGVDVVALLSPRPSLPRLASRGR